MILWCDGAHDARENMRRDSALLDRAADLAGEAPTDREPVLRLFAFDPPGITLGHAQDAEWELDLERCNRDGVPWAVRPTGGRAIFHAEEWTYAMAAPIEHPEWGGSLLQAYDRLSRLVLESLRHLGVPAARMTGERIRRPDLPEANDDAPRAGSGPAAPCFASAVRHEIVLGHRKLVGSAQRRTARALLQQGSVLLGDGHLRLADYLRAPEDARARTRAVLREASAHAGGVLGKRPPLALWAGALMTVLPSGTRRLDGPQGVRSLTLPNPGSYTLPRV